MSYRPCEAMKVTGGPLSREGPMQQRLTPTASQRHRRRPAHTRFERTALVSDGGEGRGEGEAHPWVADPTGWKPPKE